MSTIKADGIQASTGTNTDLTLAGKGTGVPDLAAGFKVGGSAGVPTASIRDDAVTLAKMASGTDGVILTYDASGNPVHVGPGSDGDVLTSTGAGSPPAFEAAAGGGGVWTLIGTVVASGDATLTITGLTSTYSAFKIVISDMKHAGTPYTDDNLFFRVGDSSGIDSGASDYDYAMLMGGSYANFATVKAANVSAIQMTSSQEPGGDGGQGIGAIIDMPFPTNATTYPSIIGHTVFTDEAGDFSLSFFGGRRHAVITLDRVQVFFTTNNVESGRMSVYGLSHT